MQELNQHVGIFHRVLIFQFFKLTVTINLLSRRWNSSLVFLLLQFKFQHLKQIHSTI